MPLLLFQQDFKMMTVYSDPKIDARPVPNEDDVPRPQTQRRFGLVFNKDVVQ